MKDPAVQDDLTVTGHMVGQTLGLVVASGQEMEKSGSHAY